MHGLAELPLPEPPPLVEICNLSPSTDTRRDWTSLERVKAFGQFIGTHLERIADGEEPVFQIAWNSAASGPVAERVARMKEEGKGLSGEWLRLNNRPPFFLNPACMKVLAGHTGPVNAVCMTPDGKQAVSSSDDKTLRVWSLDSGKCVVLCLGDQFKSTAAQVTGLVANMGAGRGAMITMENFSLARPVTTAVRLWLSDRSTWDTHLTALCPWCGGRFDADLFFKRPGFIRRVLGARSTYVLKSPDIDCPIPECGKPLRLNPFVCDHRGG